MEYTYFLETLANKNIINEDIYNEGHLNIIYILCYHVTTTAKYPFLQFMMDKTHCNDLIQERFTLPFIHNDKTTNIQNMVLNKIQFALNNIGCNGDKVTEIMYNGIIYDKLGKTYAVVNITTIDIHGLKLLRDMTTWFILPSEIINTTEICNIIVDDDVTELFSKTPELALLNNSNDEDFEYFILPDAVFIGGDFKSVEFTSIFGNKKTQEYDSCGEYYYFYRTFSDAIIEGGWMKNDEFNNQSLDKLLLTENEYGRYINGGINRFALFNEGNFYIENNREFGLSDETIDTMYPEPSITICYLNSHEKKRDMLVKCSDSFASLSFHQMEKSTLDDKYIDTNKIKYMIL